MRIQPAVARPKINIARLRDCLQKFEFRRLLIEELGWSQPRNDKPVTRQIKVGSYTRHEIAQMGGLPVFEITLPEGAIHDAAMRAAIHRDVSETSHENLLIFVDKAASKERTRSLWYWVKREDGKARAREHPYVKGQPGDLFLTKLSSLVIDIGELDESGNLPILDVAARLRDALDVGPVTKKFYRDFQREHLEFLQHIEGIDDEGDRRWYASVLLNRLMFIYFLQKKFFLDNRDDKYLQSKLEQVSDSADPYRYYEVFLKTLFFEAFAKPTPRPQHVQELVGHIKYLNGGLFLPHGIELKYPDIRVRDEAFANIFKLFQSYTWNLNDMPGGEDNELNPDVLGYIFEKYINDQKSAGAYYTRPEITEYLCEHTIYDLILERVNTSPDVALVPALKKREFATIADLLLNLDADLCRELLFDVLPDLKLLDPAVGSGAFLVAAMKTLVNVYSAVIGKIPFLNDRSLRDWLARQSGEHPSVGYFIKKSIITDNLFGVDLMEEATEIARLRLFLTLVSSAQKEDELEPLPNIDFNILRGNSLIGLMRVEDDKFAGNLFTAGEYRRLLDEKNAGIERYRHAVEGNPGAQMELRGRIDGLRRDAQPVLNDLLLEDFNKLKIFYEAATWDEASAGMGKPTKRALQAGDIGRLKPFHWGYEFSQVLGRDNGGFDAIITNPPWEIFKPNAKEFFQEHSALVTKKKMTIKEFEDKQSELLGDDSIRAAWLDYLNQFPFVNAYFRGAAQYENQISVVNGKKAGTDINLYKLFVEQCFNLLRDGGRCGIVIPSSIYTDLGAKQLREMLFSSTCVSGLFCFENRKTIFEGVDSRFKFVVLTWRKGTSTCSFPAAFMRHDVAELEHFPAAHSLQIEVELVRRLSPDSLSVMEFKSARDVDIAEKVLRFPLLGEKIEGKWNLEIHREFHMTDDSPLFETSPAEGRLPLYEGKMFHQFTSERVTPKYWLDEKAARTNLVRKADDTGQMLDYQSFRLAFRDVARNTDERTVIATVLAPKRFCPHTVSLESVRAGQEDALSNKARLYLVSIFNSFLFDYLMRQRVTAHVSFFFVYGAPVPRLTTGDKYFEPIVSRAARLICTTQEFDELVRASGMKSHQDGATEASERARLRAELDGLVAHLYGLDEDEFAHILSTFPLVADPVKVAARNAYRDVERGLIV